MGYRLSGFSTPIGGVSWDKSITEKERIEYLFFYLQSKRILTNPIEMEIVKQCVDSILDIRKTLVGITKDVKFSDKNLSEIQNMITACNNYLNVTNQFDKKHIIYKKQDKWENYEFDNAMKQFRICFRNSINNLEKNNKLTSRIIISDKW